MSAAKKPSHDQLGFNSCSQRAVVEMDPNGTLQSPGDTGRCGATSRLVFVSLCNERFLPAILANGRHTWAMRANFGDDAPSAPRGGDAYAVALRNSMAACLNDASPTAFM